MPLEDDKDAEEIFDRQTPQEEARLESPEREDNDDDDDDQFHDFELQLNEDNDLHVFSLHTVENEDTNKRMDGGILQNIQSLVSMLGGSATNQDQNEDEEAKLQNDADFDREDLLAKLMDKGNVRRSFEAKLVTDDEEDEIIIVHEEGADEEDFFVGGQQPNFEQVEEQDLFAEKLKPASVSQSVQQIDQPASHLGSSLSQVANPFKDNLFNSE